MCEDFGRRRQVDLDLSLVLEQLVGPQHLQRLAEPVARRRARASSKASCSTCVEGLVLDRGRIERLRRSARSSANSSYQRWLAANESRRTAPAMVDRFEFGSDPAAGGNGQVASVYAASRIRFDPVNSLATVSTGTTLAPRSARN